MAQLEVEVREQTDAYYDLCQRGGQPSHDLKRLLTITSNPGKLRDILAYWQDTPDEWQIFTKQRDDWIDFLEYQSEMRETPQRFKKHIFYLEASLRLADFTLPLSGLFNFNHYAQARYITWIEYFYWKHKKISEHESRKAEERESYLEAYSTLLASDVLKPDEQSPEKVAALCNPSTIEAVRNSFHLLGQGSMTIYDHNHLERRLACIAEFKEKSQPYRSAHDTAERGKLHLRWILGQIRTLKKQTPPLERKLAIPEPAGRRTTSVAATPTFVHFKQLPTEIRHKIWRLCLPDHPMVHFFDIRNNPNKPHMRHQWSAKEFRVCRSQAYASGYQIVFSLAKTCQDALEAVYRKYCHQGHYAAQETATRVSLFKELDWLPPDDLIVLRLPPTQATLPHAHTLTFSQGPPRHVGILVPKEVLLMATRNNFVNNNCEVRLSLIPDFLETLRDGGQQVRRNEDSAAGSTTAVGTDGSELVDGISIRKSGVKAVYLIVEGLHSWNVWQTPSIWAFSPPYSIPKELKLGNLRNNHLSTTFPKSHWFGGLPSESMAVLAAGDRIERDMMRPLLSLASRISRDCQGRNWPEYKGTGIIGWIYSTDTPGGRKGPLETVLDFRLGSRERPIPIN